MVQEVLKFLEVAWNYINGKKTVIGATVVFLVGVLKAAEGAYGFSLPVDSFLPQVDSFGRWVMGLGLTHKAFKWGWSVTH